MQTRLESTIETFLNTFSGFVISFFANIIVLPMFGCYPTGAQSFWITVIFTVISIVRSYFWRRLFNMYTIRKYQQKEEKV